jgi:hypothetical protein
MRSAVEGAADGSCAAVEDVGVNHRGGDVVVAEELLDGADVVTGLEEMGGKGMSERVGSYFAIPARWAACLTAR